MAFLGVLGPQFIDFKCSFTVARFIVENLYFKAIIAITTIDIDSIGFAFFYFFYLFLNN